MAATARSTTIATVTTGMATTMTAGGTLAPSLLVTTGAGECRLWEMAAVEEAKAPSYSSGNTKTPAAGKKLILHTTLHIGTPTTATAWSHDNSLLAVVGEHGRIGLWRMAAVGEKVGEEPSEVLDHAAWVAASGGHGSSDTTTASSTGTGSTSDISSLHFIGRSRYLLVLNRHRCAVDVYDLHRSVWRRVFRFDQDKMIRPQWLSVNTDDSVVAVGGVDTRAGGAALAFMQWPPVASATSALVQPALTFEAPLAQLQFSSFRRSMVCCALEDGNVHLVHTGSSSASGSSSSTASTSSTAPRILHTFHTHGQTVTGLCFSPNNRFLMGTVGLDARLVLYDVEKLVAVRTIQCAAPLVGLSFHSDGVVLVTGTVDGHLLVYDLSARGKHPVFTVDGAHAAGAVDSVRFMFSPRKAVGGGGPTVKTPVAGTETKGTAAAALSSTAGVVRPMIAAQAKTAPAPSRQRKPEPPAQEDPADMAPPPAVDQSVNYMDMFSPVVAGGKVRNANAAASIIGAVPKIDFGVGGVKPKIAAVAKKEATVEAKKEANKEAVVNAKLKVPATPAHAVVTTAASANHDPLMDTFSPLVGGQRVDMAATTSVPVVAEMKPITCGESSEATAVEQAHVVEELVATPANGPVATPALDAAVDKLKESLVERLAEVPTAPMASSITAEQHGSTPVTLNSTPATPFNMSLLSSVLEEVLDTFRTDIRRDIHNMHLELLRQFEWQRTHLEESVRTVMLEFLQPAQQTGAMANGADDEDPFYMRYLSGGGGEDADEMFW